MKSKHKRAGGAFLILNKIDFKTRNIMKQIAKFHDGKKINTSERYNNYDYIHIYQQNSKCTNQK